MVLVRKCMHHQNPTAQQVSTFSIVAIVTSGRAARGLDSYHLLSEVTYTTLGWILRHVALCSRGGFHGQNSTQTMSDNLRPFLVVFLGPLVHGVSLIAHLLCHEFVRTWFPLENACITKMKLHSKCQPLA